MVRRRALIVALGAVMLATIPATVQAGWTSLFSNAGHVNFEHRFDTIYPVGSIAPDFDLTTVAGRELRLSDFRGRKDVVLEFGSYT